MTFAKDMEFTTEQLKKVEEIASKYSLNEVAKYLKLENPTFENIRAKNKAIKQAISRGLKKRGNKKPIRLSDKGESIKVAQNAVRSQQAEALHNFRKIYAANKQKIAKQELKEVYFI